MIQLINSNFYFYFSFNNSLLNVSFQSDQKQYYIDLKLDLPYKQSVGEIISRLSNGASSSGETTLLFNSLITYNKLNQQLFQQHLTKFLKEQNQLFYDQLSRQAVNNLDKNKIKSYWFKVLANNQHSSHVTSSSAPAPLPAPAPAAVDSVNQPIQAKDYHKLMHSNVMPAILEKEKEFAMRLYKLMVSGTDRPSLDRIERLKREQKSKFQHFIKKLNQSTEENSGNSFNLDNLLNSLNTDLATDELDLEDLDYIRVESTAQQQQQQQSTVRTNPIKHLSNLNSFTRLEESYTIQLGAQLKTTHNLRLIRSNIYDFCSDRFTLDYEMEPQAIQTALSLYSDKLCALLILLDKNKHENNELNKICDLNGCDFHFDSINQQKSLAFNHHQTAMSVGDFYITKHSNLSQVHVIFHLQSFDTNQSNNTSDLKHSDLSSRHPIILGLRNVLKACVLNDIQTLTFPLLLTHEMSEEMTISWVMKRAELVLKCIKGFMIEFVNWGAQESRTLQFVVPQGLMDETFDSLRTLIPTIFRESRTVNLI